MKQLSNWQIDIIKAGKGNIQQMYDKEGNLTKFYALVIIFALISVSYKILDIYKKWLKENKNILCGR